MRQSSKDDNLNLTLKIVRDQHFVNCIDCQKKGGLRLDSGNDNNSFIRKITMTQGDARIRPFMALC